VGSKPVCLFVALLLLCLLLVLLSPLVCCRCVESSPGGDVIVTYVRGPPFLANHAPLLKIVDSSGARVDGVIVNLFAVMPGAELKYVGGAGASGDTLLIPPQALLKVLRDVIPAWRGRLGSLRGFEFSLLAFINILRRAGNGTYLTYPYVTTIPINPLKMVNGYALNSITIKVNTKSLKPSAISSLTHINKEVVTQLTSNEQNIIGPKCVTLRGRPEDITYCVEWRLEKEYAHLENTLIPIMALRIPYGYYTNPQAVYEADLLFSLREKSLAYLKVYAGIKLSSETQISYESTEKFTDFSFLYYTHFYNKRWALKKPSFMDDAVIVVGFKGSATLGLFREYDAFCENDVPWCPEQDYVPTSTTANITLMSINVVYDGSRWVAAGYGYGVDDVIGDGVGWEKYWNLARTHAYPEKTVAGLDNVTYFYESYENSESFVGIDLVALISMVLKNPETASYFPVDAGIGFGAKSTSARVFLASVWNADQYSDYCVYITSYVSRDEVQIDGVSTHLRLMLFDVEDYSPW